MRVDIRVFIKLFEVYEQLVQIVSLDSYASVHDSYLKFGIELLPVILIFGFSFDDLIIEALDQ